MIGTVDTFSSEQIQSNEVNNTSPEGDVSVSEHQPLKPVIFDYQLTFDPDIPKLYADAGGPNSKRCKKCNGRGYLEYTRATPRDVEAPLLFKGGRKGHKRITVGTLSNVVYCDCVYKNLRKVGVFLT